MAEGHRERLRMRFKNEDIDEFPEYIVLEMLLTGVIQRRDTCELARVLIREFGSLAAVIDAPEEDLLKIQGMGEAAVAHIKLLPKFFRRYRLSKWHEGGKGAMIYNPLHARDFLIDKFIGCDTEEFIIMCMDINGRIRHTQRVAKGSINAVAISVREVVDIAIKYKSERVVIAHNHTSGNAIPSAQDIETTKLIGEALNKVGIILEDHVIVADEDCVSVFES